MSELKKVVMAAAVTLGAGGRVKLTAAQAASRRHGLKPVKVDDAGAGVYEILLPLQFKAGEAFGYDGELPKSLLDVVVDAREAAAQARARAEAEINERRAIAIEARADVCTRLREALGKIEMAEDLRAKIVGAVNAAEAG